MLALKPLLKRSHHVIQAEDGDVCIGELPGLAKIIHQPPAWVSLLLSKLDGKHTVPRIVKEIQSIYAEVTDEMVARIISKLCQFKLLEDNAWFSSLLTPEEIERYDRQILQFSLVDDAQIHPLVYQERLKQSTVAVFGMGGWGCWCALQLALSGIGRIKIIDGDHVELSNLNRQVLYHTEDIGKTKVEAAKATIYAYNPNVQIDTFFEFATNNIERLAKILNDVDLVILAWASLGYYRDHTTEELIHNVAKQCAIPLIELGGDPLEVSVSPIYLNDESHPDFDEVRAMARQHFYSQNETTKKFQKARMAHAFINGSRAVNAWQSSPSLAIMSGLVCDQVIKLITRYAKPRLVGKRFYLCLDTFATREEVLF